MAELFVDTNIFLRFLTDDLPDQAQAVERLLKRAEAGEVALRTNVLVVAEIVWTLESYYQRPKDEIAEMVLAILNTPGLEVENAEILARAASIYAEANIDFIDAYSAVWLHEQGLSKAVTFNTRHFNRAGEIEALTPDEVI